VVDITEIPWAELKEDLVTSRLDLKSCERLYSITQDQRLLECIEGNRQIIEVIEEELARRRQ